MFYAGEYENDGETLFFTYRASSQIKYQFKRSIKGWVDGQLVHNSGQNKSAQISFQAELRPGKHSCDYEAFCESINASGCGGAGVIPDKTGTLKNSYWQSLGFLGAISNALLRSRSR
jgi:hypothetical protein